jgi:hypothetical protein
MTFSQLSQNVQLSSKSMEVAGLLKWSCTCARRCVHAAEYWLIDSRSATLWSSPQGIFHSLMIKKKCGISTGGDDVPNLAITERQGPTLLCSGKFFASAFANRTPLCYRFLSSQ